MWDVAIIGAGLSGLTCARRLADAGYSVCILDKSRGLGGRLATRRVSDQVRVDHGLRYWQPQSEGLRALTDELLRAGVVVPWKATAYEIRQRGSVLPVGSVPEDFEERYAAPVGMSAIAKFLAQPFTMGENLLTGCRATGVSQQGNDWQIKYETTEKEGRRGRGSVRAKRCVMAIPAPQASELLQTIEADGSDAVVDAIAQLNAVTYFPCLTVLAGYQSQYRDQMGELNPKGWMVTDFAGTSTDWIALDSSKRPADSNVTGPVIVIHSKATLAEQYADSPDLQPAASVLLRANARKFADWIAQPEWFQVHRWRYAQVDVPFVGEALSVQSTLMCGGDWCVPESGFTSGKNYQSIDYVYQSGQRMAALIEGTGNDEEMS